MPGGFPATALGATGVCAAGAAEADAATVALWAAAPVVSVDFCLQPGAKSASTRPAETRRIARAYQLADRQEQPRPEHAKSAAARSPSDGASVPASDARFADPIALPPRVETPTVSGCGDLKDPTVVTLATTTPGAAIHYTIDGTTPDETSPVYAEPIVYRGNKTISAIALKDGFEPSWLLRAQLCGVELLLPDRVEAPSIVPDGGTFAGPASITMHSATVDAVIFYTVDGTEPVVTSVRYREPFTIDASATVHAVGAAPGYTNSSTTVATFTIGDGGP